MKKLLKRFFRARHKAFTLIYNFFLRVLFGKRYSCGKNARFSGLPRIFPLAGPVELGDNARLASSLLANFLGINHPVIIATIQSGRIKIGRDFHISGGTILARGCIEIGDYVYVGANCLITDSDHHETNYLARREGLSTGIKTKPVRIGSDVWIGANVTILKGVTIGDRAIIGAGVTVRKDVAPDSVLT